MRKLLYRMLFLLLPLAGPALAQRPVVARPLPPPPDSLRHLLRTPGTPAQRQRALQRVADACVDQCDTARASAYSNAALQLAVQRHDLAGQGAALNAIGYNHLTMGRELAAVRVA